MRLVALPSLLLLVQHVTCQHIFRGGTMSWEPYRINQAENKYEVLFKYRMAWKLGEGPCGKSCSASDVHQLGKRTDFQSFDCVKGCGHNLKIADATYTVSSISKPNDWEQGQHQFRHIFNSPGPFTIAFEGKSWITLTDYLEKWHPDSPWRMQTVVNMSPRSDTGLPNHSPSAGFAPVYKEFINCVQEIQIPVTDEDGDTVRCRWGETREECGGECKSLPGAILNKDTCTVLPKATASYGFGYYPVSLVVEDFPVSEVTVDGIKYDSSRPFTQIPTQFLVFMHPTRIQCDRAEFFNTSLTNGRQISLRPNQTFTEVVCARGHNGNMVTDYLITAPIGMRVNYSNIIEKGSLCMIIEWTPSQQQMGSHFLCYTAEQKSGINSPTVCVTLRVDEIDECKSNPCRHDQVCIDGSNKYFCRNRNETDSNTTTGEITSAKCLSNMIDLVFVLDSSSSLLDSDVREMKRFVEDVIGIFGVSQDTANVGVLLFDNSVHPQFYLNDYKSTEAVLRAVQNITFGTGGTNTGEALKFLYENMFSPERGDRLTAPNVAVVLTDGQSKDSYATKYYAKLAREKGITMFAVGVGPQIDNTELEGIGNVPSEQFVFTVGNFSSLKSIVQHLKETPCDAHLANSTYITSTTPRTGCFNRKDDCRLYGEDVCTDFPGWSSDNCALWCGIGFCNGSTSPPPPCVDVIHNCPQFGRATCDMPEFRWWAEDNCRAFCGLCGGVSPPDTTTSTTVQPMSTTAKVCVDQLTNCDSYPRNASCHGLFKGWARDNCPVYCGYCPPDYIEIPEQVIGNVTCPRWKLPRECGMRQSATNCCPLPVCPAGYKLTVEREHY